MPHEVRLSRAAIDDLSEIAEWIANQADADTAMAYVDRIEGRCQTLADYPARGRLRRKNPHVRSIPFERSATILYRMTRGQVLILRVLRHGRDVDRDIAIMS